MKYKLQSIILFFSVFSSFIFSMHQSSNFSIKKIIDIAQVQNIKFLQNNKLIMHNGCATNESPFTYCIDIVTNERKNLIDLDFSKYGWELIIDHDKTRVMLDCNSGNPGYISKKYCIVHDIIHDERYSLEDLPNGHFYPFCNFGYTSNTLLLQLSKKETISYNYVTKTSVRQDALNHFLEDHPGSHLEDCFSNKKVILGSSHYFINDKEKSWYILDLEKNSSDFIKLPINAHVSYDMECNVDASFIIIYNIEDYYEKSHCFCSEIYVVNVKDNKSVKLENGKNPCLDNHIGKYSIAIHPNNRIIALLNNGKINFFCAQTGTKYTINHEPFPGEKYSCTTQGISFSPDGKFLAAVFSEQCVVFNIIPFEIMYDIEEEKIIIILLSKRYGSKRVEIPRDIVRLLLYKIIEQ